MIYHGLRRPKAAAVFLLIIILLAGVACGTAATPTPTPPPEPTPTQAASEASEATAAPTPTEAPAGSPTPGIGFSLPTATPVAAPAPASEVQGEVVGGRLVVGFSPLTHETNLAWAGSASTLIQLRPMLENLLTIDRHTGQVAPMLLEEWSLSPDGMEWHNKLVEGVPWHFDYGEFTARDVIHSLQMITQEGSLASDAGLYRALADGNGDGKISEADFRVVSDYELVWHLSRPGLTMAFNAVAVSGNLIMYSKAQFEQEGEQGYIDRPAGTGPWRYVERQIGTSLTFERVPDHWRKTAEFEELTLTWVAEDATRLAGVLAGSMHIVELPMSLHEQAINEGSRVITSTLPATQIIFMFPGLYREDGPLYQPDNPFEDIKLREAMARAIDRDLINQEIFRGLGTTEYVLYCHETEACFSQQWVEDFEKVYGYDPDKARQLIQEGGYEGLEFTMPLFTLPGVPEMAGVIQATHAMFQQVGLNPTLQPIEYQNFREVYRQKELTDEFFMLRGSNRPMHVAVRIYNYSGSTGAIFEAVRVKIDELYEKAIQQTDPAKVAEIEQEIGDYKFYNYLELPLFWLPADAVVDPDVVAEYVFPGNINGYFTHLEYVKPAGAGVGR